MEVRGEGRAMFAAVLLFVIGALNIIYGIAAIGDASFFLGESRYVFASLHTWGWITLILGIVQLSGGVSLFAGHLCGRLIGIAAATVGAVEALLAVGGAHPYWSLGVFALCIVVLHGLFVYGEEIDQR